MMFLPINNSYISTKSIPEEGSAKPESTAYLTSLTSKKYSNSGKKYIPSYLELPN